MSGVVIFLCAIAGVFLVFYSVSKSTDTSLYLRPKGIQRTLEYEGMLQVKMPLNVAKIKYLGKVLNEGDAFIIIEGDGTSRVQIWDYNDVEMAKKHGGSRFYQEVDEWLRNTDRIDKIIDDASKRMPLYLLIVLIIVILAYFIGNIKGRFRM